MELTRRLTTAASLLNWRQLRARLARCPLCGPSVILELNTSPIGVRCLRCGASAITMSLVAVLRTEIGSLAGLHVYELSSRGPLVEWLRRNTGRLTCSEFFDGASPGQMVNGVQCQDVQHLTYDAASFDVCTSTEVFEHVPNDARGFAELHRVLRPDGRLVFSVPLTSEEETVERAILKDGALVHLLPPEYHGDRIRGQGRVLAYRNYGLDLVDRVRAAGFRDVRFVKPAWGIERWGQSIIAATA